MTTKKLSLVLAVSLAALLGPALTGCVGNPVESVVEGAVEQAGGGDVDLNSDGGLPDGFPAEVPIYDGEIVSGLAMGAGDAQTFTVQVKVDDVEGAFKAINDQLVAAGFEATMSGFADGSGTGIYSGDPYGVILTVADDGSGQKTATYIVGASSQ